MTVWPESQRLGEELTYLYVGGGAPYNPQKGGTPFNPRGCGGMPPLVDKLSQSLLVQKGGTPFDPRGRGGIPPLVRARTIHVTLSSNEGPEGAFGVEGACPFCPFDPGGAGVYPRSPNPVIRYESQTGTELNSELGYRPAPFHFMFFSAPRWIRTRVHSAKSASP